jgi:FixJ family two-component response regulator
MADRVLFVDDEPAVLEGYKRTLYPDFSIDIADGAASAFAAMEKDGAYSVVVSDMRMPIMNGAEFLGKLRERFPDTVRILLTGYTDLDAAIQAINQGNIFRFLTKPCDTEVLATTITAGIELYRLITAERELLEKTLMGSIKALTDVLSAASPATFGRSIRVAHCVRQILGKVALPSPWCIEAASTLSQLGCITLESELMQRAYAGATLTEEEQANFNAHPSAAMEILKNIPRLESTSWIIGQQLKREIPEAESSLSPFSAAELTRAAKLLKLAVAFEHLRDKYPAKGAALLRIRERRQEFEPGLIDALSDFTPLEAMKQLRKVSTSRLLAGMVLDQEIKNGQGVLLVAKGQELTSALITRLENHARAGAIDKEVMAFVPM